jgi:hypothetical protein
MLQELNLINDTLVEIFCDNQSSIKIVHNPIFHVRTKHIEVQYHFFHEHILSSSIVVNYIPTCE